MTHTNTRGVVVPDSGDDILSSLEASLNALGVIIPAASVASARSMLASAEAAGTLPTAAHPAYFDVGSKPVMYRATGSKGTNGVYALDIVNEPWSKEYTVGGSTTTKAAGSQSTLITADIPTAPYDRTILAWGMANGSTNNVNGLKILMRNRDGNTWRWEAGASQQSAVVFNLDICPAGVDPQVILAATWGGTGNSTLTISSATDANRLMVLAFPRSMA